MGKNTGSTCYYNVRSELVAGVEVTVLVDAGGEDRGEVYLV